MLLWCIVFAVVTGLTYTTSVLLLALPAHTAKLRHEEVGKRKQQVLMVLYVCVNAGSVLPLVASTHNGPVAVAVPVMLASQLLSNMIAQVVAGSLTYSKQMRVGTYVLSVAALQLIDVGPTDPAEPIDPFSLLGESTSIAWMLFMAISLVGSALALPFVFHSSQDSLAKLFVYATIIGVSSALNNSLSKCVTLVSGYYAVAFMFLYTCMGATSTIASAYGNMGLNNAISVPVFTCMQVAINGLTGICVWGDAARVPNKIAYSCVYVFIMIGIYLCSSVELDLLTRYLRRVRSTDFHQLGDDANGRCQPSTGHAAGLKAALETGSIGREELQEMAKLIATALESTNNRRVQ
eukprot:TRINITY_DN59487_c0_g1_i1.p1 TRINITY_DN59487_c0_g1~~TRINITY_DN59487_c0_g1_i1.p1  ORF type:complete len:350 (-),score=25.61 TRINITY_DN59487_c0_g1_i1:169-1218(-)